jgi:phage tail-like protein
MAGPARTDPYTACHFLVELDGVTVAGFAEVSGLASEVDVILYREGNEALHARKLPGLRRYANLTLRRGLTGSTELWKWYRQALAGTVQRRNGAVVLLDDDRTPVLRWRFYEAWPCRWEGPALDAKASSIAVETLEIAHEGLDLEAP